MAPAGALWRRWKPHSPKGAASEAVTPGGSVTVP
jgi:hypothetical protein